MIPYHSKYRILYFKMRKKLFIVAVDDNLWYVSDVNCYVNEKKNYCEIDGFWIDFQQRVLILSLQPWIGLILITSVFK